ncbi:glycine cleavage system protein GcvH [Halomonas halocynthiae]|uniref:glycine cleavage system protein GcvH n=1 Tax=Halomonas halocynthiae TaxID=176290 RepID=UPI0003F80E4E|nr:glycine cleavage system protein GcvH [Halomonas halocynthiae]
MSSIPTELRYAKSHEWTKDNGDGTVTIGITEHAQEALGDVVFVELPDVGTHLSKGDEFGVVESVKAASDLYSPVTGEVLEVNEALEDAPESINESPYENAWIMKLRLDNPEDLDVLLSADGYKAFLETEN